MELLPSIEIQTSDEPDACVIWLHGLGADGNDFAPIVPELRLPPELAIRFLFPHAPHIPVTINNGYVMPAWYDILEMEIDRKVDMTQLMTSADAVNDLIADTMARGIASNRIFIAGFSQGGAVAYQVALSNSFPLGGLMVMSTYFASHDSIELHEANRNIPIAIHHGIHDPVVPEKLGRNAFSILEGHGYKVDYNSYPMEHTVCPQQITDISNWLQYRLSK